MTTECTFKLAYTSRVFTKNIDINLSPKTIKNNITDDVATIMNLNDFDIILAGTQLSEENEPIDCSIDNLSIKRIIGNYNYYAFYIKVKDNELINTPPRIINRTYQRIINIINQQPRPRFIPQATITYLRIPITDTTSELPTTSTTSTTSTISTTSTTAEHSSCELPTTTTLPTCIDEIPSCPVCYENLTPQITTTLRCNHNFCSSCITRWRRTGANSCPLCRD
jgi:hypothetical protein